MPPVPCGGKGAGNTPVLQLPLILDNPVQFAKTGPGCLDEGGLFLHCVHDGEQDNCAQEAGDETKDPTTASDVNAKEAK